jgi:hypothetical protein
VLYRSPTYKEAQQMRLGLLLLVLTVSGCINFATTGDKGFVIIEDIEHTVFVMKAESSFLAHQTDYWKQMTIQPSIWRTNILAIEKYTGCKVDVRTIQNKGMQTIAMVQCEDVDQ